MNKISKFFMLAVAVVAMCAATATAATLITGKQVKNGSLTGKDVKPKSLAVKHLSDKAVSSLKGQAGPKGEKGDTGAPGATGAAGTPGAAGKNGISRVLARSNAAAFDPPNTLTNVIPDGPTPILAVNTGYVITAQAQVNPTAPNWKMDCEIRVGDEVVDKVTAAGAAALDRTQIFGHAVIKTTDAKLLGLYCTDDSTATILDDLTVSAVAVDEVG